MDPWAFIRIAKENTENVEKYTNNEIRMPYIIQNHWKYIVDIIQRDSCHKYHVWVCLDMYLFVSINRISFYTKRKGKPKESRWIKKNQMNQDESLDESVSPKKCHHLLWSKWKIFFQTPVKVMFVQPKKLRSAKLCSFTSLHIDSFFYTE